MQSPRAALAIGSRRWIASLAALTAVAAFSIDMSLPAQPTLARVFEVDAATAQLTLSLFLIGYAVMQALVGYLSDAWGRRPVLLGGLAVFVVAGVACALSPSIEVLLACRVLQGAGAAAAPVVARAMVRDTQPAEIAARLLATMLAALAIAPMAAPVIGGALLGTLGWRAIFATLAVWGAALLALSRRALPETLPPARRAPPSLRGLVRNYRTFFTTRGTRLPTLLSCASFAGQFSYIAVSPFVLMDGYGVSHAAFALYFALTALALMAGSLFGARLLRGGRSPGALLAIGATLLLAGGALVLLGTHTAGLEIAGFLPPMIVYFFGIGISSPSATAIAMEPVPQIAGTASAALGVLTTTAGSLAGYVSTKLGGSSPTTFALIVAVMGAIAALLGWSIAIGRRRARQKQQESR